MAFFDFIAGKKLRQEIESLKNQIAPLQLQANQADVLFDYMKSMGNNTFNRSLKRPTTQKEIEISGTGFVGACVNYIAEIVASRKFTVNIKGASNEDLTPVDVNHWAQTLLDNPNPYFKGKELKKLIVKWYFYNGNSFVHGLLGSNGTPVSLWVLPAPNIGIKISQGGYSLIDGYTVGYGNITAYSPDEIIHFRNLEPSLKIEDMILGKSIVLKAIDSININNEANQYLKRYFANDTNPPLVWQTQQRLDQDVFNVTREKWNAANPNFKLTGALPDGATIANLNNDSLDVSLDVLDGISMRSIGAIIGVAADYILYGGSANRASMEIMQERMETDTIDPLCTYFAECWTDHLRRFDKSLIVTHETYTYQDAAEVRAQEDHDLKHGIRLIDDVRADRGLPTIQGGNVPMVAAGIVTLDSVINPPAQGFGAPTALSYDGVKKKSFDGIEEKVLVEYWKRYDKLGVAYKEKLQGEVSDVFVEMGKAVAGKAGELAKGYKKGYDNLVFDFNFKYFNVPKSTDVEAAKKEFDMQFLHILTKAGEQIFDLEYWKTELIKRTGGSLDDYMITVIENALKDVNMNYDDLSNSFDKLIQTKLAASTDKITSSVDTIKEQLQQYLKDNTDLSVDDLTKGIQEKFGQYSEGGAARIAQTTSTFARETGKAATWGDFGIKRQWLDMRDGSTREEHEKADGQIEDENGMFNVGGELLPCPAGGGIAANNCNCRCGTFAVRKK